MPDHEQQQQRVALITGASKGLGREIARAYARAGLRLVITARGAPALEAVAAELRGQPSNGHNLSRDTLDTPADVLALPGDVADPAHAEQLVGVSLAHFGHIDVLINNASELGPSPLPEVEHLPVTSFETILRTNVVAPLRLIQLVLPGMRERGAGLIVNISSDAAVTAYPTWGGYGASKAALEQLSRVLGAELEGSGVRVYVVDPGDMQTDMHRAAEPGVDLSHLPLPEAVAPAFLRLLERPSSAAFARFEAQQLLDAPVGVG